MEFADDLNLLAVESRARLFSIGMPQRVTTVRQEPGASKPHIGGLKVCDRGCTRQDNQNSSPSFHYTFPWCPSLPESFDAATRVVSFYPGQAGLHATAVSE
jgi:hypothetical protein